MNPVNPLVVGDSISVDKVVTDDLVRSFAELSGDFNPIHLDDNFAKATRFGRRIAHGMISGALISAVLGTGLKGCKFVYLSQMMKFLGPVYINDTITATATVKFLRSDNSIVTFSTECTNQDAAVVVEGEAVMLLLPPD